MGGSNTKLTRSTAIPMPAPPPRAPPFVIPMPAAPPRAPPFVIPMPAPSPRAPPFVISSTPQVIVPSPVPPSKVPVRKPSLPEEIVSPEPPIKVPVSEIFPLPNLIVLPELTQAAVPTISSLPKASSPSSPISSQQPQPLTSSPRAHRQNTQIPVDISARRVVRYDANNYLIPNVDIRSENSRPFNNLVDGIRKTDRYILHVCSKHISREGCHIKYCFRFHVCHKWIRNNCNGENCSLDHHFNGEANNSLYDRILSRRFGEDELKERLRRNLFFKKDCKEDPSSCICTDFILKQCKREVCESFHINSLYSWEVFRNNLWVKFSNSQNKEIEKNFCDSSISSLTLDSKISTDRNYKRTNTDLFANQTVKIDFKSMFLTTSDQTSCRIRRLSTPSDITVFKTVATRWLWYWEDENGNWNFYSNASVNDLVILPFSDYIETQFLKKVQNFTFKLNYYGCEYTINFEDMSQTNENTDQKNDIRRRPMPSYVDSKWKEDMTITGLWTNLTAKGKYLRQKVPQVSPEFYFIQKLIVDSISVGEIFIERIENPYLWEAYQLKKAQMMRFYRDDLQKINEQYILHGTSKDVIDKICSENLDWRLYGTKVGNVYGKGTYFANTAGIASHYAYVDDENYKWIFVCLVLIGRATVGNSKMTIPPIDPITNERFDSTVNDKDDPQIFVKYNLDEYYPAYLVKFKTW